MDEESIEILDERNSDDEEEYSPEPRVFRSSSKQAEQKYKLDYAVETRHQNSDINVEAIESAVQKKKIISPMHTDHYSPRTKVNHPSTKTTIDVEYLLT